MSNNLLVIKEKDYGLQVSVYVTYGAVHFPPLLFIQNTTNHKEYILHKTSKKISLYLNIPHKQNITSLQKPSCGPSIITK